MPAISSIAPVALMVLEREEESTQSPWPDLSAFEQAASLEAPARSAADVQPPESRPATAARILVVDDEDQIRLFVKGVLEDEGLAVDTAASGREAVAQAEQRPPALVILDIMLPDVPGEEVAELLRARFGSALRILVITADTHAEDKAEAAGAYAFLRKPFDLSRLIELVQQGLAA